MEVFVDLKSPLFSAHLATLRKYRDLTTINAKHQRQISNIENSITFIEKIHKGISDRNRTRRTQAQRTHNVKTNRLLFSDILEN